MHSSLFCSIISDHGFKLYNNLRQLIGWRAFWAVRSTPNAYRMLLFHFYVYARYNVHFMYESCPGWLRDPGCD